MSARIFVHPRAVSGAGAQALAAFLQEQGYDMMKVLVYQKPSGIRSNVFELVREIGTRGDHTVFRRMNGEPFKHFHAQAPVAA